MKIKTNFLLKLMFMCMLALVLINCSTKEDSSLENINENNNFETANINNRLSNPLEIIGIEHNKFMVKFTSELEASYINQNFKNVGFLSNEYITQFSTVMNNATHDYESGTQSTIEIHENIYSDLNVNEWYNNDNITSLSLANDVLAATTTAKDKNFTMNLLNDLYAAINQSDNDIDAYIALDLVIKNHEHLILSEKWKSTEVNALGALAVAKHSKLFWENYDFSTFTNNSSNRVTTDPRSSIIVGADVAGFVIGGVAGEILGTSFGWWSFGAGTVGGVLGGKVIGAFSASASAITAISIYDAAMDFFS